MEPRLSLTGSSNASDPAWAANATEWLAKNANVPGARIAEGAHSDGATTTWLSLHPAAEDIEIVFSHGSVHVDANTSTAGPGYHLYVVELLRRFADAMQVTFRADETGTPANLAPKARHVELLFASWLSSTAKQVLELLDRNATGLSLSLPATHAFLHPGALATPLGPRDRAWVRAVAADGLRGFDIFPWRDGGVGASFHFGRALFQLWTEARFRPPANEEEAGVLESIDRDLEIAYRLEPQREIPWHEWAEVLALLGKESLIATRAQLKASTRPGSEPIGYRRNDVVAHLSGGFSVRLPGSFAESWDERGTFSAWEGSQSIWFTSLTATFTSQASPSSREALAGLPPLSGEILEEEDGPLLRRAAFGVGEEDGRRVNELHAHVAYGAQVAIATICFEHDDERDWALNTFRSILRTEDER